MKDDKDKTKVSLSKELRAEINDFIKANPSFYQNLNKFISIAAKKYIRSVKYNIENMDSMISEDGESILPSKNNLTLCSLCERPFMKNKDDLKETSRICAPCKNTILIVSKMLEKEDKDFLEMKNKLTLE